MFSVYLGYLNSLIWVYVCSPFYLVDTAGIRSTEDVVEKIGVKKAMEHANGADLIIYVVDSSVVLDEDRKSVV